MRHLVSSIILLTLLAFSTGCSEKAAYTRLEGQIYGTYYSIHYNSAEDFTTELLGLLNEVGSAISKYDPQSEISDFNRSGRVVFRSPYLRELMLKTQELYDQSGGALDPTLMPLIEAWGFGTASPTNPDSSEVDSLLQFLDFPSIVVTDSSLESSKPHVTIDLNAVGEGYGIDYVGKWLTEKGITDFKVELGGEVLCRGKNSEGKDWKIGIENPKYEELGGERLYATVLLVNEAIGTSGSYRHFRVDSLGNKLPHILDPRTGYPVSHQLLSVTIKAKDCVTADGLATACMVLGEEEGKKMIEQLSEVEAFFIYYNQDGKLIHWESAGFKSEKAQKEG